MSNLMEKLALSKAIMDKADRIKNTNSMNGGLPPTSLQEMNSPESFNIPTAKYNIPAEFNDTLVHIKGALAAARQSDSANPKKESSGSQFFLVQGKPVGETQLENFELQKNIKYTDTTKTIYRELGGAPQLDKEYTIFGRVIDGLDVIDAIADEATDSADRPVKDVKIISVKVIK